MEAVGLRLLDPGVVSAAFKGAGASARLGCARIDADRFAKVNTVKGAWPFLEELRMTPDRKNSLTMEIPTSSSTAVELAASTTQQAIQGSTEQPRLSLDDVKASVRGVVIEILGDSGLLDSQGQFPAGAFDSLSAVELSNKISDLIGVTLPGTLVFDYPSVPSMATYLYDKLMASNKITAPGSNGGGGTTASGALVNTISSGPRTALMPLGHNNSTGGAVPVMLTMASRIPQPFPVHLPSGCDAISMVPYGRWDLDSPYGSFTSGPRVRFASWLDDVASFDPGAFQLTGNEAEVMDPQQRLLLEVSFEVLQSVGTFLPKSIDGTSAITNSATTFSFGSEAGVYVGIQQMEYGGLASQHMPSIGAYSATSTPFSVAAGRLSFTYGFTGPAVSIDTACSSAMVAAHGAAQHLEKRGGAALSAGINLMLAERTTAAAQIAGMLTMDGRCKALDAGADGYVRAEACVVLALQTIEEERILSSESSQVFLRATFVNQDGRSSSLTAPNGPAQQRVLHGALAAARALPADVMGLEMHGTGTALGDPIEVGAATAVFPGSNGLPLRLTAAKSRVGHAEPAAGSIGILQTVAQLTHMRTHAVMHLTRINPYIAGIYGELKNQGQPLPFAAKQDGPGVGAAGAFSTIWLSTMGVSSFAFQGTNAHVLLSSSTASEETETNFQLGDASEARPAWQHKRYWYCSPPVALLGRCVGITPNYGTAIFETRLNKVASAFLHDHTIRKRAVVPAAAMLEAIAAVAQTIMVPLEGANAPVLGVSISSPLLIKSTEAVNFVSKLNLFTGGLELESSGPSSQSAVKHLTAATGPLYAPSSGKLKRTLTLQERMFEAFMQQTAEVIKEAIPEVSRAAKASAHPAVVATGHLSSQTKQAQQPGSFITHPALLDAMTHVAAALQAEAPKEKDTTRVPAAIEVFSPTAEFNKNSNVLSEIPSCAGSFEGMLKDGTAVSSFVMAKGVAAAVNMRGFHAKPVKAGGSSAFLAINAATRMLLNSRKTASQLKKSSSFVKRDLESTTATVKKLVTGMLGVDVELNQPLMEAGMDSLGAVELRTALNKTFAVDLPATVTFDYPTVSALASCINTELEAMAPVEIEGEANNPRQHMGGPGSLLGSRAMSRSSSTLSLQGANRVETNREEISLRVSSVIRKLLGVSVPADQPLMEAGIDSLSAVELRTALNKAFKMDLPATITFDYPTIAAMTAFIAENQEELQIEAPLAMASSATSVVATSVPTLHAVSRKLEQHVVPASLAVAVPEGHSLPTSVVGVAGLYPSIRAAPASVSGVAQFAETIKVSADLPRRIPLEVSLTYTSYVQRQNK